MAAPIDLTGATTAEEQLLILLYSSNNLELANLDAGNNPITNNVQLNPNTETNIMAVTLNLPITAVPGSGGANIKAAEYLEPLVNSSETETPST